MLLFQVFGRLLVLRSICVVGGAQFRSDKMKEMIEEEIMDLNTDDFRDLSVQEEQQDNFRRMFQMLGIIYNNQVEIKKLLTSGKNT